MKPLSLPPRRPCQERDERRPGLAVQDQALAERAAQLAKVTKSMNQIRDRAFAAFSKCAGDACLLGVGAVWLARGFCITSFFADAQVCACTRTCAHVRARAAACARPCAWGWMLWCKGVCGAGRRGGRARRAGCHNA